MDALTFTISLLAVWRVTHLLQAEDGPFDLVFTLRKWVGNGFFGKLMDCFYCLSIWVALAPGLYFGAGVIQKIITWLALSGGAILLEKISSRGT